MVTWTAEAKWKFLVEISFGKFNEDNKVVARQKLIEFDIWNSLAEFE